MPPPSSPNANGENRDGTPPPPAGEPGAPPAGGEGADGGTKPVVVTEPEVIDGELDFTGDELQEKNAVAPEEGKYYDPRRQEDEARKVIAYVLIGLLWFLVVSIIVLLSVSVIKITEIKEFAVLLGPIVTLVSAATGFYYGTKSTVPPSNGGG